MSNHALEGGFKKPAIDSAQAFRAVMNAMARPGTIHSLSAASPPAPLSIAAGVCLLTLCDHETPVHLGESHDHPQVREWIAFHTGAPLSTAEECSFAVGTWNSMQPLTSYAQGTSEYPDRSATLVIELDQLENSGATLAGPGIKETASLKLPDIASIQENHKRYPLGLDFLFTSSNQLAALPRSTEVSE